MIGDQRDVSQGVKCVQIHGLVVIAKLGKCVRICVVVANREEIGGVPKNFVGPVLWKKIKTNRK